jgi:putative FmdB family regulatory protein
LGEHAFRRSGRREFSRPLAALLSRSEEIMPVYDYLCTQCGPFTEMRPMAEADRSHECPVCGEDAPRAYLTAPYLAAMSQERRLAHATNERSASAPLKLSGAKAHAAGCSCCSSKPLRLKEQRRTGTKGREVKGFPARRPWMISH